MKRKSSGFTIVELLIVIVIIGILAALVIVSYNGMQQRANNTQRITAAKEWQKLISLYLAQNSQYPAAVIGNHVCLGTGYPTDVDANPDEDCNISNNPKHPYAPINNAFNTAGKLPAFPPSKLIAGAYTYVGLSLRAVDTLDPSGPSPKVQYPMLHYWLDGNNQDCVLRPIAQVSGGYITSNASYTANVGGLTHCVVLLPYQTEL